MNTKEQIKSKIDELWTKISDLRKSIKDLQKHGYHPFYLKKYKESVLQINRLHKILKAKIESTSNRKLKSLFKKINKDIEFLVSDAKREAKLNVIEKLERFWPEFEVEFEISSKGDTPEILFDKIKLHPRIRKVSETLFKTKHYAQAIFEAFKAVNNFVKNKSGLRNKEGQDLMFHVFNEDRPILKLNNLLTKSDRDEQIGFKFLYGGAMRGIRNPKAHEHIKQKNPYRTLKYLAFASLLMERAEEARK